MEDNAPTNARHSGRDEPAAATAAAPPAEPRERVRSYALLSEPVRRHYLGYYKLVFQDGALDLRTKELIAFGAALVLGSPNCVEGHLAKLRKLGVGEAEIEECVAVALGVAGANVVDRADIAASAVVRQDREERT